MINIKKLLLQLIKIYQITPLHAHSMCRFIPTCSEYMAEAIEKFGAIKGINLGIKRLMKCHPFGKYGFDPVEKEGKNI